MKPNFHIRLDEYGTQVWLQMDGERTVEDIANRLGELYGEKVEPLHDRLEEFLHNMECNRLLKFSEFPCSGKK